MTIEKTYDFMENDNDNEINGIAEVSRELDEKIKQFRLDHPDVDYSNAARYILDEDPDLAHKWLNLGEN